MTLIDRDALYSRLRDMIDETDCNIAIMPDVMSEIRHAPEIEAMSVVRARWLINNCYGSLSFVCSECGFMRDIEENFGAAISCPNCGAKMDKEDA